MKGQKSQEIEAGVCNPFIVNAPGVVAAGVETDALTDFSDLLPTFVELGGGKVPEDLVVDGVSIAPMLLGKSEDTSREWVMALGHGPAWVDEKGVRGQLDFATRVIRDKRFKVWVSKNKKIFRLHDLINDPWEETNLFSSSDPIHQAALKKFQVVVDELPDQDARPLYEVRAANSWDKRLPRTRK